MSRMRPGFLFLLMLLGLTSTAQAQVIVRVPGVQVIVPPKPRLVQAPGLAPPVVVPGDPGLPPPVPVDVPTRVVPPVMPSTTLPARVPTVGEFVAGFRPASTGGHYEVVLLHPCTGCPVKVCFDLPCGCPRKIRCVRGGFEVRYGLCKAVVVRFLGDGSVQVRG